MRLCKDCKYFEQDYRSYICNHPHAMSPVTGDGGQACNAMRASGASCGVEGKLWEGKQAAGPGLPDPSEYKEGPEQASPFCGRVNVGNS